MYIVAAQEMRLIDRHTIDEIGIPAMVLMENAGRAIAEEAAKFANVQGTNRVNKGSIETGVSVRGFRWLILVGKGNNGGDGLVCARHLVEMGFDVSIVYADRPDQLQGEAAIQRDIVRKLGIVEVEHPIETGGIGEVTWDRWDGIIDALLGTGTSGEPRGSYASLIEAANASGLPIVSVDIPSGLDANTGQIPGACITASVTVTLAYIKRGLLLYPGAGRAGEVIVRSIGIPLDLAGTLGVNTYLLDHGFLVQRLGRSFPLSRQSDTHKGTYGHVLTIAGSIAMSGAGLLCSKAALRTGSGLVSWGIPQGLVSRLTGIIPEVMLRGFADGDSGQWKETKAKDLFEAAANKQAVIIGPGLGRWKGDSKWFRELWDNLTLPIVIDADALNMFADGEQDSPWTFRSAPTVITPHPGEMAKLCGLSIPEVQRDRIEIARNYAKQHGVIVVLKGAHTVIADPAGEVFINRTGNPGMSTGGTGDVLAGMIGSLLGQGIEPLLATITGVYWHGLAGDQAASVRRSVSSLIAGDIIDSL
jgi:ADP-dependent NAD(P)H-hydrate dehydratase / NAD(P)H-hydrate epimerase